MGRRKRDDDEERYSAFIGIQLKPSQRRALEAAAANSDLKLSDFARAVLVSDNVTALRPGRDKKALRELAAELSRLGNLLNQIARVANTSGQIRSEELVAEIAAQVADVFERIIAL